MACTLAVLQGSVIEYARCCWEVKKGGEKKRRAAAGCGDNRRRDNRLRLEKKFSPPAPPCARKDSPVFVRVTGARACR
jgi:hypothetical protein